MPVERQPGQPHLKLQTSSKNDTGPGSIPYLTILGLVYGILIALSLQALWRVPRPLKSHENLKSFSEGRALQHVKALTDIGIRLVGSPELDAAADYLMDQGKKLAAIAKQTRPDLLVQIQREQVSGAVETEFLHKGYTNMYNNVTNIVLVVSPTARLHEKSVLVNAHFDSTLGTTGASDDAACVGIILEIARTLIANQDIQLAAPVIFLMNGAEEAFCPAAHGFMQQSPWARDAGVFLNLESTGTQGPDFLFQQTGQWPMQAYVTAAPHPRGSVVAQDFFQLGLVPADTDYRMFSAELQGSLPGIDTAFLLGAGMYHTDRDAMQNLCAGTLQAMGVNTLAAAKELGNQLALRRKSKIETLDTEKVIFFDVLGLFMVMYPFKWACYVHQVPLVLGLSLPFLQRAALPSDSLFGLYASVALETIAALVSMACAIASCLFAAILRVTLLGNPMAWYGQSVAPYVLLIPPGVAGLLLPYLGRRPDPKLASLGNILAFAVLSSVLTHYKLGASILGTIWSLAGLLALSDLEMAPFKLLKLATINSVFPILVFLPNAIALSSFVLQKTSFMGAQGQPSYTPFIADGVAGAVIGMVVISATGNLTPWIAYACGKGLKRLVLMLYTLTALLAIQTSLGRMPYTDMAPKRIFLQHLHEHDASGTIQRSVFAAGAVDSVPLDALLVDKRPDLWTSKKSGWEWQTLFPFNEDFISSMVLEAPGPEPNTKLPHIEVTAREELLTGTQRLTIQPRLPGTGYLGSLNITGPILDWSLPRPVDPAKNMGTIHSRLIRFVGSGSEDNLRFSLDIPADSSVTIRVAAAHARENSHLQEFSGSFPSWSFTASLTTFASEWLL